MPCAYGLWVVFVPHVPKVIVLVVSDKKSRSGTKLDRVLLSYLLVLSTEDTKKAELDNLACLKNYCVYFPKLVYISNKGKEKINPSADGNNNRGIEICTKPN